MTTPENWVSGFCREGNAPHQHRACKGAFLSYGKTPERSCTCWCHELEKRLEPVGFELSDDSEIQARQILESAAHFADSESLDMTHLASMEDGVWTPTRLPTRYAAFWTDVNGVEQMECGWETEADAFRYLEALITHGLLDGEADVDVRSYEGEVCPW